MGNFLYLVAVVLIVLWALGFYAMDLGNVVHLLLIIAVVAILLRLIRGRRI